MSPSSIAFMLHILSALVWVGGMFFAHMILRPSVAGLGGPERLNLWKQVFGRFFGWVWIAVSLIPVTGFYLMFQVYGGVDRLPLKIHYMTGIGLLMVFLFAFLFFFPYRKFLKSLASGMIPEAAGHQAKIRLIVTINLVLGLSIFVVMGLFRF